MSWTLLSQSHPKARKRYLCDWCGEPIASGEVHYTYSGVMDDEMQRQRMHLECETACNLFFVEDPYADGFNWRDNGRGCTCDGTCGDCLARKSGVTTTSGGEDET